MFSCARVKMVLPIALLLALLLLVPAQAQGSLPWDDSFGGEPIQEAFLSDREYRDDSIHVVITQDRAFNTDYWVARITIQDPSQLRTTSAAGFESQRTVSGKALAKRVQAVFAINGDYFSYLPNGYLIRQGKHYRDLPAGNRDVLLVDKNGDFFIELRADKDTHEKYGDKDIVNSFNFGPALVVNGERVTKYWNNNNAANHGRQRMAICQVEKGKLEYVAVACAGPRARNIGMTLDEFSQIVFQQGVENAYNLDGGYSTMMIFNYEYVNSEFENTMRPISDIIYFATTQGIKEE